MTIQLRPLKIYKLPVKINTPMIIMTSETRSFIGSEVIVTPGPRLISPNGARNGAEISPSDTARRVIRTTKVIIPSGNKRSI